MPEINDIFSGDAFGVVTLSSLVNNQPFTPGQVGNLGLFDEEGVTTTIVGFDMIDGAITLVAPTPRGGPGVRRSRTSCGSRSGSRTTRRRSAST